MDSWEGWLFKVAGQEGGRINVNEAGRGVAEDDCQRACGQEGKSPVGGRRKVVKKIGCEWELKMLLSSLSGGSYGLKAVGREGRR